MIVFGLAHLNHDGDHVEYVCAADVTVTRAWEICDRLNADRDPYTQLELVSLPVLR